MEINPFQPVFELKVCKMGPPCIAPFNSKLLLLEISISRVSSMPKMYFSASFKTIYLINSKYFPIPDWLKPHA